jgi:hypothetical protein
MHRACVPSIAFVFDPRVQFQLEIDAIQTFMAPTMPTDITQVKGAQAEAQGLLYPFQSGARPAKP